MELFSHNKKAIQMELFSHNKKTIQIRRLDIEESDNEYITKILAFSVVVLICSSGPNTLATTYSAGQRCIPSFLDKSIKAIQSIITIAKQKNPDTKEEEQAKIEPAVSIAKQIQQQLQVDPPNGNIKLDLLDFLSTSGAEEEIRGYVYLIEFSTVSEPKKCLFITGQPTCTTTEWQDMLAEYDTVILEYDNIPQTTIGQIVRNLKSETHVHLYKCAERYAVSNQLLKYRPNKDIVVELSHSDNKSELQLDQLPPGFAVEVPADIQKDEAQCIAANIPAGCILPIKKGLPSKTIDTLISNAAGSVIINPESTVTGEELKRICIGLNLRSAKAVTKQQQPYLMLPHDISYTQMQIVKKTLNKEAVVVLYRKQTAEIIALHDTLLKEGTTFLIQHSCDYAKIGEIMGLCPDRKLVLPKGMFTAKDLQFIKLIRAAQKYAWAEIYKYAKKPKLKNLLRDAEQGWFKRRVDTANSGKGNSSTKTK